MIGDDDDDVCVWHMRAYSNRYQFLLASQPTSTVDWENEHEETKAPFDIKLTSRSGGLSTTVFIEVKTTRSLDRNLFELSLAEFEFAANNPPVEYHIYRVYGAGAADGAVKISVVKDPIQLLREGKTKLCMAI